MTETDPPDPPPPRTWDRAADDATPPSTEARPIPVRPPTGAMPLDRRRHPRVRPAARLPPVRPGPVDVARLELDSPAVRRPPRRRRRAGRAARVAGRADRHAEPRPAPVRAGLLDRRPAAPDHAGRPGRAGDPRRPARPRAGRRGRREASASPRSCASRRSSSSSSCRASCRSCPQWQIAAYYGPARAVGGDFYDFVDDARRPDRHRRRRRDRQGRPRGAGHGPDPQHPPRRGVPAATRPARSCRGPTTCSCPRCRPRCS